MNRRTAIKNTSLLAISAVLAGSRSWAKIIAKPVENGYNFHRFLLGKLECTVVSDGHIIMKPVQPNFAPGVPPAQVSKLLHDSFLPTDEAELGINLLVIKKDQKVILIDSGCGVNFGDTSGWAVNNLADAGIKAADITDVVLTHGHPDHLGGLVDKEGKLIFPNAQVHLSRIEKEFWMADKQDLSKSKMKNQDLIKLVIRIAKQTIAAVEPRLHLFEDNDTLFNCLKLRLLPGHTPGHTVITIYADGQELVHTADTVHSPVLVFAHPEWGFDGDSDFLLGAHSRRIMLEELSNNRKMTFSYHLLWPGLGHVRKKEGGYEYIPATFALPDKG